MVLRSTGRTVLAFSCLHSPYHHPHALDFLADVARDYKPDVTVNLGDEVDGHAVSRFTKNPDLANGKAELNQGRRFIKKLAAIFPELRCCVSNHTWRYYVRAQEAGIPSDVLKPIGQVLEAPASWVWEPVVEIDRTLFMHGEGYSGDMPAKTAAMANRRSVVMGHVHHAAGANWLAGVRDRIFGLSVGCLVDPRSEAYSYGRTSPKRPNLGCGVIVNGVPLFLPML